MRTIVAVAVTAVALVGCGSQTPQQEAGSFLADVAGCFEQNRDDIIAAMDSGDGPDSPEDYENLCGMDREGLSPAAQSLVEEHGRVAVGEVMETVLADAFASALTGDSSWNDRWVDGLITAFSDAADAARNAADPD